MYDVLERSNHIHLKLVYHAMLYDSVDGAD